MSVERGSVVLSDAELDRARELVIGILDLVLADPGRFRVFLKEMTFDHEAAHALTEQPHFMLSVLDTAARSEDLLAALESDAGITRALMELTGARLAFHVAAELSRQGEDRPGSPDMGDRARQKLRELSRQEKSGEPPPEQATKKFGPGSGGH
jgi:hypothetical protein